MAAPAGAASRLQKKRPAAMGEDGNNGGRVERQQGVGFICFFLLLDDKD